MKKRNLIIALTFVSLSFNFTSNHLNVEANEIVSSLNNILDEYRHNGVYTKETEIYLNKDAIFELSIFFHDQSDILKRTTYYSHDELWMSDGNGTYSYYGTDDKGNLTHDTVKYVGETSSKIGLVGVSMEEHYYTMKDIVATNKQNWTLENNIYSSEDKQVIEWFKGFTAPCYLGFNKETSNYIDLTSVEIEKTSEGLELRLLSSNDQGKLTSSNNIFSKAVVTYEHIDDEGEVITCQTGNQDGLIKHRCLECNKEYEKVLCAIGGTEVDTYPGLSNADVITFQGCIYTYGGSPDGSKRTDKVYCFNTYSNKLYELDVRLCIGTTSHRAVLHEEKAYIFGGLNGKQFDNIQIHDFKNNTLTTSEIKLPFGANCFQVGKFENKVYFMGGSLSTHNGKTDAIYEMNLDTLEVKMLDVKLPTKVFKGGWITVGKYAYIISGTDGNRLDKVFRFDMVEHRVSTMNAKLPYLLSQARLVLDNKGNILVVGGTNNSGQLMDDVFVYNIETDTLTQLEFDLPLGIANTCVANVNGKVYVLAGDNATLNVILRMDEDKFTNLLIEA